MCDSTQVDRLQQSRKIALSFEHHLVPSKHQDVLCIIHHNLTKNQILQGRHSHGTGKPLENVFPRSCLGRLDSSTPTIPAHVDGVNDELL